MVSETICLDIIRALFGRTTTVTQTFNLDDSDGAKVQKSQEKNALSDRDLVRPLLAKYDLSGIDSAIRWLTLGEYIGKTQWGIRGPWVHVLTTRGVDVAEQGKFADEERALFYLEEPHQVFLAHQFDQEDTPLELILRSTLTEAGMTWSTGESTAWSNSDIPYSPSSRSHDSFCAFSRVEHS